MTATLVAKDLSGGHGHRTLFSKLSLTVAPGDVVGVVGANGAGKSTLLRLLSGVDQPQGGKVSLAPADAFVGWLPQEHERTEGETIAAYIARRTGCARATADMETTAEALGSGATGADDAYSVAFDRWMASGAADLEERIPAVLADLGLEVGSEAVMTGLSGGQAARVALAALLLSRFDVVLLDEPTNDLDLDGLARLEAFVQGLRGGVVLVSHDREFLARCVSTIVGWTSRRTPCPFTTADTRLSWKNGPLPSAMPGNGMRSTPPPRQTSWRGHARSVSGAPKASGTR